MKFLNLNLKKYFEQCKYTLILSCENTYNYSNL